MEEPVNTKLPPPDSPNKVERLGQLRRELDCWEGYLHQCYQKRLEIRNEEERLRDRKYSLNQSLQNAMDKIDALTHEIDAISQAKLV